MTHLTRIIILVVGLAVIGSANSQISKTITYQGVLTDASDARITGTVALDLNIYAVSGGGSLYADSHASVDVANGLFTVVIGTGSGGAIGLPFNEPYELGVTVDSGTELSPRTLLTAAPYALNAGGVNISGGSNGDVLTNDGNGNGAWGAPGAGPQGPAGAAGATGAQGPAGADGAQGPAGPVGSEFWDGDIAGNINNTNSGNVGIGTTSPSRILHVVGASRFTNKIELFPEAPAVAGDLMLYVKGLAEVYSLKMLSAGSAEIYASGSGNVYLGDSNGGSADNFYFNKGQGIFNSLGHLGIGTDAPVRKLHVREGGDTGASVSGDAIVVLEEDNDSVLQFSSPTDKFFDLRWADSGGNGQGRIRYNHNDDHMSFSTNESERVRIDSSGNVGIGTTAPATKLEVAGLTNSQAVRLSANGAGDNVPLEFLIRANNNSTSIARIFGAAGSTSSDNSLFFSGNSVDVHVELPGDGGLKVNKLTNGRTVTLAANGGGDNVPLDFVIKANNNSTSTAAVFGAAGSTGADNFLSLSGGGGHNHHLSIMSSGKVGIGTTSPDDLLHIFASDSGASPASTSVMNIEKSGDVTLNFLSPTSNEASIFFGDSGGSGMGRITYNHNGDYMRFYTNESESMRIDSSGNVGIGTTSPAAKLEVSKDGNNAAVLVSTYRNSASGSRLTLKQARGTQASPANSVNNDGSGITHFARSGNDWALGEINFNVDGNVTAGQRPPSRISFWTTENNTAQAERMRITSGGNVGIGTTSPVTLLHVQTAAGTNPAFDLPSVLAVFQRNEGGPGKEAGIDIIAGTAGTAFLNFGDADDENAGAIRYDHSSNSMRFTTNGVGDRVVIDSSGNVGIGTSSPSEKLHIDGSAVKLKISDSANYGGEVVVYTANGTPNIDLVSHGGAASGGISFQDGAHNQDWAIKTNAVVGTGLEFIDGSSSVVMNLAHGGNVGIGTTNPGAKLEVAGGDLKLSDSSPNLLINDTAESANGRLWKIASDGGYLRIQATRDDQGTNGTFLEMFRNGALADRTAIGTRLMVGATGAFSETLEVVGNSYSSGTVQSGPYLKIDGTSPVGVISTPTSGGYALMIQSNGGRGDFDTGAPLRLNPAGDPVGIGTGTGAVTEMLVVNGNILANGGLTRSVTANANTITMSMVADDALLGPYITWGVGAAMKVKHTDGAGTITNVATFQSNGVFSCGALVETSDRNEKQNIQTVDNALDKVMNMRGVNFEWKQNAAETRSTDTQLGFVAQELEEVLPEVVMTNEDGLKSVAYSHVTAVLVEAVKELQATIETLKAEVGSLKNQNN